MHIYGCKMAPVSPPLFPVLGGNWPKNMLSPHLWPSGKSWIRHLCDIFWIYTKTCNFPKPGFSSHD